MKRVSLAIVASLALAAAGTASASEELAKKSGCLNCHNVEGAKKMGASFKDLSAKYKGDAKAAEKIVPKITKGQGHPKASGSEADHKAIVDWLLKL